MARVASDGSVLRSEVPLTSWATFGSPRPEEISVVWTGTEWVVVWATHGSRTVSLQRVAVDGSLAGALQSFDAISPSGSATEYYDLGAAYSPTLGVVISFTSGHSGVAGLRAAVFVRVLGDGSAPFPPIQIASGRSDATDAAALPGGTVHVVYKNRESIYHQRVESDGSVIAPPEMVHDSRAATYAGEGYAPRIEEHGGRLVASWTTRAGLGSGRYRYDVWVAGGPPGFLRPTSPVVSMTTSDHRPVFRLADVALRGGVAVVTWQQGLGGGTSAYELWSRRYGVPATGAPSAFEPAEALLSVPSLAEARTDAVWTDDTHTLFAWSDSRWGASEVYTVQATYTVCAP